MITCPSCEYPNDEYEHRCERCGRKFDAGASRPVPFSQDEWADNRVDIEQGFDQTAEWEEETAAEIQLRPGVAPASCRPEGPAEAVPYLAPAEAQPDGATASPGGDWRNEVSTRVERFRQRRRAQASLPLEFDQSPPFEFSAAAPAAEPVTEAAAPVDNRQRKVIPFEEIRAARVRAPAEAVASSRSSSSPRNSALAPALGGTSKDRHSCPSPRASSHSGGPTRTLVLTPARVQASLAFPEPQAPVIENSVEFPVAPLAARVMSGLLDAALLALGYALFFGVYTMMGGQFPLQRGGIAAFVASLALLAGAYLFLFLYYSAATPGMRWLGLRLVDFEGVPARRGQRVLRLLGLVASCAALGFGFLWAAFDEEGLTWHDRVSRTCLTMEGSPFLKPAG